MASIPPPHGINETDYEAIEAAVTETVRGRWFLSEYARRNRLAETRQLLDAMARLETAVLAGQNALPSADPSIRLLIQRIKEIAGQLNGVAGEMRAAGVDEQLVSAVDTQARAVAGMMRSASASTPALAARPEMPNAVRPPVAAPAAAMPRMPRAEPLATARPPLAGEVDATSAPSRGSGQRSSHGSNQESNINDPRFAALADLDGMALARKLALFT